MTTSDTNGPVRFHDAGGPEGQIFGGYELESELGRGGMGVVYKATQRSLKRTVALKMLTGIVSHQDLSRFLAEAETAAHLHHANIVHIYEVGKKDAVPFFAMEFVEGGSLADRLKKGVLPAREAAQVMSTVARAVHFAHERGVVHRDLKPANVLLDATGAPKIADFGIAKRLDADATTATVTGAVMGTPGYMAPEQAEGSSSKAGPWSDVYALGAMMYELLTGRPPFVPHESETPIYLRIIAETPVSPAFHRPEVPRDLEAIVMMCLQKDRRDRFKSAADLADDLDRFLADEPIKAKPPPLLRRSFRWIRRHPWLVGACLLAIAGAGLGLEKLWRWEMYERPRIEHALAVEIKNGGLEAVGVLDDDAAAHCGVSFRLTRLGRRGPLVKAEVINAKGRPAAVRDLLGYDFLQTWLQGAAGFGGFTARGRESVNLEVTYEKGEATQMTGRDRNGRVTSSVRYRATDGEPGHTRAGIGEFTTAKSFNYTMPGGASHAEFERDENGYDVRFRFFTGTGAPARNGEGVFGYEKHRGADGRVDWIRNFDADGKPMANVGGVTQFRYGWNARGQLASVRYEDAEGHPVSVAGSSSAEFAYDAAGNPASVRRRLSVGPAETRGTASTGAERWSVKDFVCNQAGEVMTVTDRLTGDPTAPSFLSRLEFTYDSNGFPLESKNFASDQTMISRSEFGYDERGNGLEVKKYDADGDLVLWTRRHLDPAGYPALIEELDEKGEVEERTVSVYADDRLVRTSFEYADHSPRPVGYGHTMVECRYHPNGYLIEERYSGYPGGKVFLKVGYDEVDRRTGEVWVDENDKPVPGVQGWVSRKLTYRGSTGSTLTDVYLDADGHPARNHSGFSGIRNEYDQSGIMISQIVDGYDGSEGFVSKRERFNITGRSESIEYFDESGGKAWCKEGYHRLRTIGWDAAGNPREVVTEEYDPSRYGYFQVRAIETWKGTYMSRIVMSYEDREGRPVGGPDGCPGLEREFDDEGRELTWILTGCPTALYGSPILRRETEWGEDGKIARRNRQALDAERRPIASFGSDHPTRVEETLDDAGTVVRVVKKGYAEALCGYSSIEADFDSSGNLKGVVHRRADGAPAAVHAIVSEISPDAQKAAKELQVGDVIRSVNGDPIGNAFDFVMRGAFTGGWIEVEREGKRIRIEGLEPGRIGIGFSDRAVR